MIVGRTGNLTRDEIAETLAAKTVFPRQEAARLVDLLFESMTAALVADRPIQIRGFGTLKNKLTEEKKTRLPNGTPITVAPKIKVVFTPAQALDQLLNAGRGGSEIETMPLYPEADQPPQSS